MLSTSEIPLMVSANSELRMLGTIRPITFERLEDRLRASRFGTYPISSTTARTRSRISFETLSGSLSARETVITETPALRATSRMRDVVVPPFRFLRFRSEDLANEAPGYCLHQQSMLPVT